jgi:hypothetical protein
MKNWSQHTVLGSIHISKYSIHNNSENSDFGKEHI